MAGLLDFLRGDRSPMEALRDGGYAQPQPAPQPQGGGFRDTLRDLGPLIMLMDPMGRNGQAAAMMMRRSDQRAQGAQDAQNRNQTFEYLRGQGVDEGTASMLVNDQALLRQWFGERNKKPETTPFEERAKAAGQYGLDPNSEEGRNFILSGDLPAARGGAAELGLNPQTGIDENGNPVLVQLGKDGKAVRTAMPEGVTLSKEPVKLDAGTHFVLLDPITRQPVGQIPKDLAGAESQKAMGKAQGEAAFDLPRAELNARQTIELVDKLVAHPGRETATGKSSVLDPRNYMAGTDATDFRLKLDQAQGRTFLEAYSMLKGGGQITEVEGQKAQDAIAALNRAQSDEAFKQALLDFRQAVTDGLEKLRRQAGVEPSQPAPPSGGVAAAEDPLGIR